MSYVQLPEATTRTRLDAFQGAQAPPSVPLGTAPIFPSMYPIPGLSRPPVVSLPNSTNSTLPSYPLGMYGADGGYIVPNHQLQSNVYPPANLISPVLPINSGDFRPSFLPVQGMFLGNATTAFLPLGNTSYQGQPAPIAFQMPPPMQPDAATSQPRPLEHVAEGQYAPVAFQWSPMQPDAAMSQSQALDQLAQDVLAAMQYPLEPQSVHTENRQPNVALDTAPSASKVPLEHDQRSNESGSHLQEEKLTSEDCPQGQPRLDKVGLTVS